MVPGKNGTTSKKSSKSGTTFHGRFFSRVRKKALLSAPPISFFHRLANDSPAVNLTLPGRQKF